VARDCLYKQKERGQWQKKKPWLAKKDQNAEKSAGKEKRKKEGKGTPLDREKEGKAIGFRKLLNETNSEWGVHRQEDKIGGLSVGGGEEKKVKNMRLARASEREKEKKAHCSKKKEKKKSWQGMGGGRVTVSNHPTLKGEKDPPAGRQEFLQAGWGPFHVQKKKHTVIRPKKRLKRGGGSRERKKLKNPMGNQTR